MIAHGHGETGASSTVDRREGPTLPTVSRWFRRLGLPRSHRLKSETLQQLSPWMYCLHTSSGYRVETSVVEVVASALAHQISKPVTAEPLTWTVTTPYGDILSETLPADTMDERPDQIDRAYVLLLTDYLSSGAAGLRLRSAG